MQNIMTDPLTCKECNHSFEKSAILQVTGWWQRTATTPPHTSLTHPSSQGSKHCRWVLINPLPPPPLSLVRSDAQGQIGRHQVSRRGLRQNGTDRSRFNTSCISPCDSLTNDLIPATLHQGDKEQTGREPASREEDQTLQQAARVREPVLSDGRRGHRRRGRCGLYG